MQGYFTLDSAKERLLLIILSYHANATNVTLYFMRNIC